MPDKLLILPAPLEAVSALISGVETERPPTAVDAATFLLLAFAATGQLDKPAGNAIRFLSDATPLLKDQEQRVSAITQARELIHQHRLAASLIKTSRNLGIGLVTARELDGIRLYAPDGRFASDIGDQIDAKQVFSVETRHGSLTGPRDQVAAFQALRSDYREFSHVEAFAGTGKTHLVRALLSENPPEDSIYMVKTQDQAVGMRSPGSVEVNVLTWWQALDRSLSAHVHRGSFGHLRRQPMGDISKHDGILAELAASFGVPDSQIVAAYRTLQRWAATSEPDVSSGHVPYLFRGEGLSGHPATDQLKIAALARELWRQQHRVLTGRAASIPLTTTLYAKLLEYHGIPLAFTGSIFVDEAHDLPVALARLLEAHLGGAVCLGDRYQSFGQEPPVWLRGRQIEMSQSVRFGGAATNLINSAIGLLDKQPYSPRVTPNVTINTKVLTLRDNEGRHAPGLHVYGSPATLLRDLMLFFEAGRKIYVNADSQRACKAWADEASKALAQDRAGGGERLLARIEKLAAESKDADLVEWVLKSLSRLQDLRGMDVVLHACTDPNQSTWLILAQHSRNLEKPVVAIHPCCFAREVNSEHLKHFYVAASRARETIWLPPNAWR